MIDTQYSISRQKVAIMLPLQLTSHRPDTQPVISDPTTPNKKVKEVAFEGDTTFSKKARPDEVRTHHRTPFANQLLEVVQSTGQKSSDNRSFNAVKLLCETDGAMIYEVKDVTTNQRFAAKIGDDDSINHQISIYNKIGAHPHLHHIHGIATVTINGTRSQAMLMNLNDLDGDDALETIRAARENGTLSEDDLMKVILPYISRALVGVCSHMAGARVAHRDIDPSNLMFTKDGTKLEAIDLELAAVKEAPAKAYWSEGEIQSGNPMVNVYPEDCKAIDTTLRMFAGLINEYGQAVEPECLTESMAAFKDFLSRLRPENSSVKDPAHFEILSYGNDQMAHNLLENLFKDATQEE